MQPLQLTLQRFLTRAFGSGFVRQALLFLLQPGGIIALPRDAIAAIEFQNPPGNVVQKIAVVGDRNDGAWILLQVLLKPRDGLRIQVVGGFVEQQDVWLP